MYVMLQIKSEPFLVCDDALSVEIAGEKKHFVCISSSNDKINGFVYELFDNEGYIITVDDKTLVSYLSLGAVIIKPSC